jgi:hypothetical protein
MPSTSVTVPGDAQPSYQAIAAKTASAPGKVTGKLASAIDIMIEEGQPWDKAAVKAGLTVRAMRLAIQRPHVVAYLKARREVFRVNASAGNIHRLVKMRDQDENKMAVVQAIKTLEQIGDEQQANGRVSAMPGLQIVIVQSGVNAALTANDTKPLITIGDGPDGSRDRA